MKSVPAFTGRDGNTYRVADWWYEIYDGKIIRFHVGHDRENGVAWYVAVAIGSGVGERWYEYDYFPSREQVYSDFVDDEAEREIDRAEARTEPWYNWD